MNFNDILKQTRKERGYTQKDIYLMLKVSPNCYASWEQGRTQPDIENIKKLCNIFDVSADYLIGLTDEWGNRLSQTQKKYNIGTINNSGKIEMN